MEQIVRSPDGARLPSADSFEEPRPVIDHPCAGTRLIGSAAKVAKAAKSINQVRKIAIADYQVSKTANTANDWASFSGILRDAYREKGNFGLRSGTATDAQSAGQAWVGDGARLASDGKVWLSWDGLRQRRPPSYKPKHRIWQPNFESRRVPDGRSQTNGPLDVTDLP